MYGSPPHVRGKETRQAGRLRAPGITPAYAEKSYTRLVLLRPMWDHPRVCGEKTFLEPKGQTRLGSPPRMRGKGCNLARGVRPDRITPAYAGKRSQDVAALQSGWDHPRVCGEKQTSIACRSSNRGSPPRMRGKERCCHTHQRIQGITPAYAGKRLECVPA